MLERKRIKTDLCVVGGGIAGICAAVSAARLGIRVVLMHERPVLGGNASSEIRMWICGAQGENMRETGLMEEIALKNLYYNPTKNPYIFDNILLETVTDEKNITLLLNCTCMDAKTESGNYDYGRNIRITEVSGYQMTTQTFFDVEARLFADCSGDSILAPLTGAEFRIGREAGEEFGELTHVSTEDRLTMGNSCLIQGRETDRPIPFIPQKSAADINPADAKQRDTDLYKEIENFWYLELGGNRDTISDAEEIASDLKGLAAGYWKYIKETPEYKADNFELEFMGSLPGKRESRRYVGEYIMKQQDISEAVHFPDTVAYGGWPIDDHYPDGFYHKGVPNTDLKTDAPYPIPYRILYSKNVDNLFFAGRNISSTHTALSSLRVMATCGVMGQAAGTAAAIAVKENLSPHGLCQNIGKLQEQLLKDDCFLPFFKREISEECHFSKLNCDNGIRNGEDRQNRIYGNKKCGITVKCGEKITYILKTPADIGEIHIVFNSDLDRTTVPGGRCEQTHGTRCNILLNSPHMHLPKTLCRDFELRIKYADGNENPVKICDNKKRSCRIPAGKSVSEITLIPLSNWGGTETVDVFSFDF